MKFIKLGLLFLVLAALLAACVLPGKKEESRTRRRTRRRTRPRPVRR